jgi:hypothetical protein
MVCFSDDHARHQDRPARRHRNAILSPQDVTDSRERWRRLVKAVGARLAQQRQAKAENDGDNDGPPT